MAALPGKDRVLTERAAEEIVIPLANIMITAKKWWNAEVLSQT
jgi:hypothetical protein